MIENNYDFLIGNFTNTCLFDMKEHTKRTNKYILKRFCSWAVNEDINFNDITEHELKKYISYLKLKSNVTIRQQLNIVSRYIKFSTGKKFEIKEILNELNIHKIHKKQIDLPKVEFIKELIKRAKEENNFRDAAILNILLSTGLRTLNYII